MSEKRKFPDYTGLSPFDRKFFDSKEEFTISGCHMAARRDLPSLRKYSPKSSNTRNANVEIDTSPQ
jgi:hypothetical protein